jgi:hypothetical protein
MTGGDIPALINFNNVYARYDADSGEYDPPSLEPVTAFEKKIYTKTPGGFPRCKTFVIRQYR